MTGFNDSFEDELVSKAEMVAHGKNIGATHLLICYDGDLTSAVYVMPGEYAEDVRDDCSSGCASVEMIDLRYKPSCHWSCNGCNKCGSAGHGNSWF